MKKVSILFIYLLSFIYMEFLYKVFVLDSIFRISIVNMLLFIIPFSIILYLLTKLMRDRGNKVVFYIIMSLIPLWFSAQYVVKGYFDFYISMSTFEVADQVGSFLGKAVVETVKRLPGIILFYTPLILSIIFRKHISFKHHNYKKNIIYTVAFVVTLGLYALGLNIDKKETYSAYNLIHNVNDVSLSVESLGVLNTFVIDIYRAIFGFEENVVISNNSLNGENNTNNESEDEVIVYDYNNLDIDFKALLESESNSNVKKIHEYMSLDSGTLKNEYTGMFEGKNLILFMAESFNEIAVKPELTPTLYKLTTNGFVFDNFYTPTIYSTIGGEFQEMTGLYAQSTSILSKFRSGNIAFPQGIGNVFKNINYSTYAYHNNSYKFQDRNKYLNSLGFDNFKACYNGLEKLINCKEWPQSDVSMIEATVNDYINEDNFMVFYASVSGHASYTWGNAQSKKHKEEYLAQGFTYSEHPASYLAAQMELDKALALLIEKLDAAGKLEDTVIALVGDHYPYELTIDEINEISSYEKDSVVEVNRSNFVLWNSEMDTIKIDKVGSQLDVIPTIYNTFGIDYDSRLFIGKDILSTEGGLAMFGNRSWVTDKGTYFANSHKFVPKDGVIVDDDYVSTINGIVNNKITMSKLIIDNNYYSKVFK